MRRFFAKSQRTRLWLEADGKCQRCGCELGEGWHADHVVPWSAGGETTTDNGQALCPKCNEGKGGGMSLRDWQRRCLARYLELDAVDFLIQACPGAGKTRMALAIASTLRERGIIDKLIVVVHSDHLKRQWARSAWEAPERWTLDRDQPKDFFLRSGMDGFVATYQWVATNSNADLAARIARRGRTLVVLDEIHHCSDVDTDDARTHCAGKWGERVRVAFDATATRRLALTGTPFRTDGYAIPWVRYDDDHICRPDYRYPYSHALRDGVCRFVEFPVSSPTSYFEVDGEREIHNIGEANKFWRRHCMRSASRSHSEWMRETLDAAHRDLVATRKRDPRAGGMVLCRDKEHAASVRRQMQTQLGTTPVLALSGEEGDDNAIFSFEKGTQPWLVAVRQVSEGVDIPRLRVLVYATTTVTELFFTQAMGRVLRSTSKKPERACAFIPEHADLQAWARAIADEQDICLPEAVEADKERLQRELSERSAGPVIHDRGVIANEQIGTIAAGAVVGVEDSDRVAAFRSRLPELQHYPMADLRDAINDLLTATSITAEVAPAANEHSDEHPNDERERSRRYLGKAIQRIAHARYGADLPRSAYKEVGDELNRIVPGELFAPGEDRYRVVGKVGIEALRARVAWARKLLGEE